MGRAEYRESLKKDKNRKKKRTEVSQEKAANIHATGDVTIQPAKSQGNSGIEEKKRKKKTAVIIFLILLIAAGAVAAWMLWPRAKSQYDVDREDVYKRQPHARGRVPPCEGGRPPGRIHGGGDQGI